MKPKYPIPAGKFKKNGKPVAQLIPIEEVVVENFGCMQGTIIIQADITKPIDVKWDADGVI